MVVSSLSGVRLSMVVMVVVVVVVVMMRLMMASMVLLMVMRGSRMIRAMMGGWRVTPCRALSSFPPVHEILM